MAWFVVYMAINGKSLPFLWLFKLQQGETEQSPLNGAYINMCFQKSL
jgi:hypothetical protein